jgi:hypothetical protein
LVGARGRGLSGQRTPAESDNRERLFEGNGLLLTPTIDHLFDRGFISFENGGELLISPVAHEESLNKMGIMTNRVFNVGGFAEPQREFRFLDVSSG